MKNKRFLLILYSLGAGGAENICRNFANYLVELDPSITASILVYNRQENHQEKFLNPKIGIIDLEEKHVPLAFFKLRKAILITKPDVIIDFSQYNTAILNMLRSFTGLRVKVVARACTMLSTSQAKTKSFWVKHVIYNLIRMFYRKSDFFIAQCDAIKQDMIANFGVLPEKVRTIYNPLSRNFKVDSPVLNNSEREKNILFVGSLIYRKGLDLLLKSFATVLETIPDIKLLIVGQGPLNENLLELVEELNITSSVTFLGKSDDPAEHYRRSLATALTSLWEGFPNVLVESLCCGTPVVSFDCPSGPAEIVEPGQNGFLVKYQDIDDLTRKIIDAVNKRDWDYQNIKMNALNKYRSDHIFDEYFKVAQSI